MSARLFGFASLLLVAVALPALASIDTTGVWNGSNFISSFGIPNTQTYGQVIQIPTGVTQISSFSFRIKAPTTLAFRGEIYAWDGAKATGAALYDSAPVSTTNATIFEAISFTTGGTSVTAGQQYVLFASSSKDNTGHSGGGQWGSVGNNTAIAPGQFVFMNNSTDDTQWTSATWSTIAQDLAMTAAFNDPVPPPPAPVGSPTGTEWAMVLMAAGILVIAYRSLAAAKAA